MREFAIRVFVAIAMSLPGPMAQSVVLPMGWAEVRGNVVFAPLEYSPFLQIHTELRGSPMSISQLALRQSGYQSSWQSLASTYEIEVLIGHGDYARRIGGSRLLENFREPPTVAMALRTINVPNYRTLPPRPPAPFTVVLPFDHVWNYSGTQDLVYMITATNRGPGSLHYFDGMQNTTALRYAGMQYGQGCLATGQTVPMELRGAIEQTATPRSYSLEARVLAAPILARSVLLLGAAADGWYWPQLCSYVYVRDVFHAAVGFSDTIGDWTIPTIRTPYDPSLARQLLYAQAYSLDNGRHPMLLPISVSNGVELEFPPLTPAPVAVAFTNSGGGTGMGDGFGMITRLQ